MDITKVFETFIASSNLAGGVHLWKVNNLVLLRCVSGWMRNLSWKQIGSVKALGSSSLSHTALYTITWPPSVTARTTSLHPVSHSSILWGATLIFRRILMNKSKMFLLCVFCFASLCCTDKQLPETNPPTEQENFWDPTIFNWRWAWLLISSCVYYVRRKRFYRTAYSGPHSHSDWGFAQTPDRRYRRATVGDAGQKYAVGKIDSQITMFS